MKTFDLKAPKLLCDGNNRNTHFKVMEVSNNI